MRLPMFTATESVYRSSASYRNAGELATPATGSVVAAIPFCGNCDDILENCARNRWRPRAVCNACFFGHCFSGVEDPTPGDPTTPSPV
jgi:hypothetical protein